MPSSAATLRWTWPSGGARSTPWCARGTCRCAAALRRWLERAGLEDVRQQLFPEEIWAPLPPAVREVRGTFLRCIASLTRHLDLPEADQAFWRAQADPAHPDALVNHPDYYHRSGYDLALGRVPTAD